MEEGDRQQHPEIHLTSSRKSIVWVLRLKIMHSLQTKNVRYHRLLTYSRILPKLE